MSPSTSANGVTTARALLGEDPATGNVPLAGAQGFRPEDQQAIDRTINAACAVEALTARECRAAFEARLERYREFQRMEAQDDQSSLGV